MRGLSLGGAASLVRVGREFTRRVDRRPSPEDVAPGREALAHGGQRAARESHAVVVLAHDLAGEHRVRAHDVVEQRAPES